MTNCRSCGAEVEGAACTYCGTPAAPETPKAPSAGGSACPRCEGSTGLVRHFVDGAAVHGCPRCGGLWVPAETLEPLVEAGARMQLPEKDGAQPQRLSGGVQYLRCPQCSQLMARRNYARVSGILIDACPEHGVWLDAGELQAMRRFVASGGRQREAKAEAEKAKVARELERLRSGAADRRGLLRDLRGGFGDWG